MTFDRMREYRAALIRRFSDQRNVIDFRAIHSEPVASPVELLDSLMERCLSSRFVPIALYSFPPYADPFHVVKVVVPGAEDFSSASRRVGRRLAAYARNNIYAEVHT